MKIKDILFLAFASVRSNKLRTGITVSIIAFGIMALVGINTAIEAMKQKFTESFAAMGASGFTINYRDNFIRRGPQNKKKGNRLEKKSTSNKIITKREAEQFKQNFDFPSQISLSLVGSRNAIVSSEGNKTNPIVTVMGGDENYSDLNGFTIMGGRNFNDLDIQSGRNVCLIGYDINKKFFSGSPDKALEKIIRVNNIPYRVIGVLDSKGSSMGGSMDNIIITSYNSIRRFFSSDRTSFNIGVKVGEISLVDQAVGEAEGVFRAIRQVNTFNENNFTINKSDRLVEIILKNLASITWSAVIIGIITLFGAAIGLMNIMLVAVGERTKEIGLIKAIGGKQSSIRRQFLYESIIISLMGAVGGIVLGILLGNSFSLFLKTSFVLPWQWIIFGICICTVVGILAGLYPSLKASRMNPIQALRYE